MFIFNYGLSIKSDLPISFTARKHTLSQINTLTSRKGQYLPYFGSDKGFKSTVVNRELPSLHGGSLEITLKKRTKMKINPIYIYISLRVLLSEAKNQNV